MPRTVVAAASAVAAEAGESIADMGGNAVDVAIGATIASMSTELGIVSPGGGAFITIWDPTGEPILIDAYAEMPGRALGDGHVASTERIAMAYGDGMETVVGWGSVAVPGAFAGFQKASDRWGVVPWAELLKPTIKLLTDGFPVSGASGYYLSFAHDVIFGWDAETKPLYHRDDGTPVEGGDILTNPQLAECLSSLASEGASDLYSGNLGAALVRASRERGGLITKRDLDAYEPILRTPSRVTLRGWDVATNPPPAVGGIAVVALLQLAGVTGGASATADGIAAYAAAQEAVFGFRRNHLDGVPDRDTASRKILELSLGGDIAGLLAEPPGERGGSAATVHTSAVDDNGLACSITVSAGYGSGAVIPGTGFGLNNSLGELELTSEGLHALQPGTRLLSNMAPTIVRHPGGATIALGSAGADRITSAIASVILNHIAGGMDIGDAVSQPRIHAEVFNGVPTLVTEPAVDTSLVKRLSVRELPTHSMYLGGVQVAMTDGQNDLRGVADPRRSGAVRIGG